jgi:hypothetical protein
VRYPLFDGQACGRVLVGAVDSDGYNDIIAFGHAPEAFISPVATTMQTFLGDAEGLDAGEVHCCLTTSPRGAGGIFDMNGDGEGDPLWAGERMVGSGDVVSTELTLEKSIRAPENGYTGDGLLFTTDSLVAPPFMIGNITPEVTGVIVIADSMLLSMVGNGTGLGLEPTQSLALDPVPDVRALATIEINEQVGIDLVGVGPDGLVIWAGSIEGVFADATVVELPGEYTHVESIDVDLDGNRELVLFGEGEPVALVDRAAEIEVSTAGMPVVSPPATVIAADSDEFPDVVSADGDNLVRYPGDGEVFGEPIALAPIGMLSDVKFADFDGNGEEDLVACDDQGLLVIYAAAD